MQTISNYPPGHCEEHVKWQQSLYVSKQTHSHRHRALVSGQSWHGLGMQGCLAEVIAATETGYDFSDW